jgi:hypothetical protein
MGGDRTFPLCVGLHARLCEGLPGTDRTGVSSCHGVRSHQAVFRSPGRTFRTDLARHRGGPACRNRRRHRSYCAASQRMDAKRSRDFEDNADEAQRCLGYDQRDIRSLGQAESRHLGTRRDVQQVEVHDNGILTSAALFAPAVLTQFMFTLILLLFILSSGDMFYEKLVHVLPTFKDKRQAMRIAHDIERKLSRYLLTITLINAALGTVVAVAMWLLGMPSPAVFGVMAFLLTYVPYLGAIAGIAVVSGIALLTFDSTGWVATVGGVYLLISSIEGQFVTPYFVGRSLRLNTVVVFIAVSFWAWLWSAVGLLVAVPLLVAINTFCQHIDALNGFGKFLSERHAEKETETSASSP